MSGSVKSSPIITSPFCPLAQRSAVVLNAGSHALRIRAEASESIAKGRGRFMLEKYSKKQSNQRYV